MSHHEPNFKGGEASSDAPEELEAAEHAAETDEAFADSGQDIEARDSSKSVDERVLEAEKEVLMARAEMENFRKRMQRDLELQIKYANMPLMKDLLEVLDNLQRALEAADGNEGATQGLREGVAMVSQQMSDVLSKFGCKKIEALGLPFDPNFHEAISQMPSDDYAKGTVMYEAAIGYQLHDRVVRPSHVIVSTGPAE